MRKTIHRLQARRTDDRAPAMHRPQPNDPQTPEPAPRPPSGPDVVPPPIDDPTPLPNPVPVREPQKQSPPAVARSALARRAAGPPTLH